jgi:hypothetical protein
MRRKFRTAQALLHTHDENLRILWKYTEKYTLLVNELFAQVPQHQNFERWKRNGTISREAVEEEIFPPLRKDDRFAELPSRIYVSAVLIVTQAYKAWLKQQAIWLWQLLGKQRWFNTISSVSQLAVKTDFSFEQIQARAQEVLQQIQQAMFASQASNPPRQTRQPQDELTVMDEDNLMGELLDAYDETSDSLTQLAIVHLLLNNFQVAEKEHTPEAVAKRLNAKKIGLTH